MINLSLIENTTTSFWLGAKYDMYKVDYPQYQLFSKYKDVNESIKYEYDENVKINKSGLVCS